MSVNCCFNCQERHTLCHADCEKYLQAKKRHDEVAKKERVIRGYEGAARDKARAAKIKRDQIKQRRLRMGGKIR